MKLIDFKKVIILFSIMLFPVLGTAYAHTSSTYQCNYISPTSSPKYIEKGIDVSSWQRDINWHRVKQSGISFAFIRAGFGRNEPNQVDRKFHEHIRNAKAAGIKCGAYHYSYAVSPRDAVNEANFFLSIIKGYKLEYPVVFDIEEPSMVKLGRRTLTDICKAFCSTVKNAGYYVMIYTNLYWLRNNLYPEELKEYPLWLSQYNYEPSPEFAYHSIWQYTSQGHVDGINGNIDINLSKINFFRIIKHKHLNGF